MVNFCSKCSSILLGNLGEDIKCPNCGHSNTLQTEIKTSQKINNDKKEFKILDDEKSEEIHPIVDIDKCADKNCDSRKAYYWTMQTRSSDEPETQFYKCVKCRKQWREYR